MGTPKRRRDKGPDISLVASAGAEANIDGAKYQLGRIESITVENFKSYEGVHSIGPFDKFCCVIGPNGSGKSNVMDAISFCLGIRAKHLRGERLKDLIYRREEESVESNTRTAKVILHFRSAKDERILFERHINARGESSYRCGTVRAVPVTYEEFLRHLSNERIFVKARNFLVFQGDVMDLARRQGTDLTGILETISGSDQLKDEYEELVRELEVNQEKARVHFQHQLEIRKTVQQLDKQREVVERYQTLSSEKVSVLREMNVLKLFAYQCEVDENMTERTGLLAQISELDAFRKQLTREIAETDREFKSLKDKLGKADENCFIYKSNVGQKKPFLNSCLNTLQHYRKKKGEIQKRMEQEETNNYGKETKLREFQKEREKLTAKIASLRATRLPTVQMTQSQRRKYEESCIKSEAANLRVREQIRDADEKLRRLRQEKQADSHEMRDLEERIEHVDRKLEGLVAELSDQQKQLISAKEQRDSENKSLGGLHDEMKRIENFRETLKAEERRYAFELDLYRTKRDRLEQAESKHRLAEELRTAFPNSVVGRVSELLLPSQKRFELALQTSLASRADAFVVTDRKAGADCIQYLKKKGIPPQVFLPLDRLKGKKDAGPLHGLTQGHHSRHLATECVLVNEKFLERNEQWRERGQAIINEIAQNLLGGVIIVDDLLEARKVSYTDAIQRKLTIKSVSLHGEVIQPNGNMETKSGESLGTVQFGGMEELNKLRELQNKMAQIQKDLLVVEHQLQTRRNEEDSKAMQTNVHDRNLQSLQDNIKRIQDLQSTESKNHEAKKKRMKELQGRTNKNETTERKLVKERDAAESELLQRGKQFFVAISEELGVPDLRELKLQEENDKKRHQQELDENEDRLRELQSREQSLQQKIKDNQVLKALQLDLEGYANQIREEEARKEELEGFIKKMEDGFSEEEEKKKLFKKEIDKTEEKMTNLKVRAKDVSENLSQTNAKAQKTSEKLHTLFTVSCRILRECTENQIEIPFRSKDTAQFDVLTSRAHELDEKPLEELEKAFASVKVDFTCLPSTQMEKWKISSSRLDIAEVRQNIEQEYEERLHEIAKELETLHPNMCAPEQHQMEADKLEEIKKQGQEATAKVTRLQSRFETCKAERTDRFMKCFRHVETVVAPFYKELTTYDGYEGGSAYLDIEDVEEPYNGGITFTACPPGKRFFPMDLLSGGEKSMASMALLFAMHSYQPPPFMVLDEVDAPFDRKNTDSLVRYLQKLNFQCLVISLKDTFFKNSDSLVGVYKDKVAQTSGVITLPLQKLGDQASEMAVLHPEHIDAD